MISLLAAGGLLATALVPQVAQPASAGSGSRIAIISGVVRPGGQLDLGRLGLGDGGVDSDRGEPNAESEGRFLTSGGVLVRTLAEGVKLDFPSGGELLVDRRARVHVRDGARSLPNFSGLRIQLLDGAQVDIVPQNGSDRPLREVVVRDGRTEVALWRAGRASARRHHGAAFLGRTLHAMGDGRVLYEIADIGPAIICGRELCPRELEGELPQRAVLIVGDVLARSLIEVSSLAQQRAAGDPRTQQVAGGLASLAPRMFAPDKVYERPAGARGDLVIPLVSSFRMELEVRGSGPVVLSLFAGSDPIALCEWTTTNITRLHLVQRDAGRGGRPRYLMRGHALRHLTEALLVAEPSRTARARARRVLIELGAGG